MAEIKHKFKIENATPQDCSMPTIRSKKPIIVKDVLASILFIK